MWHLGFRMPPTVIILSASDRFQFCLEGGCICQTGKGSPWGELLASEDAKNISFHPLYPSDNIDLLTCDVWGPECLLQSSPQVHQIISNFAGRGAAFVKPGKGRPEVSNCPLRMLKISILMQCIHLTTLMHLHVTSGVRNASYSCCLKRIRSFPIFLGGELHLSNQKHFPEVSCCPLRTPKNYQFPSILFVWKCWCTYMWHLESRTPPSVAASSASDHFQFCWEGSCICQTWKGLPWG
jgi:hypothetical protein